MSLLPCECRSCRRWDGISNMIITCHYTECICGERVNLLCGNVDSKKTTTPRYVCAQTGLRNCGYDIDVGNKYFKEYKTIVGHADEYLRNVERETCTCGEPTKVVVEKVTADAGTLRLDDELQLFYKCKNEICTYKKSVLQLETSRIRCVCRRYCKLEGSIYSCQRKQNGCGTYFHELDSITFLQTILCANEIEDNAFVYLPLTARKLSCGQNGILKFKYNKQYTNGDLMLVCKDLFCDYTVTAILQPR